MSLTFRLNVPEPCNGNFNSGHIYFWGEAVWKWKIGNWKQQLMEYYF
jgi:hypothetical protein